MATPLVMLSEGVRWTTFAVMAATTAILFLTHRRSRATVFTDVALKAAALLITILYLTYIADNAAAFHGDPVLFEGAINVVLLMLAIFFLSVALYLQRFTTRTDGAVIVSPQFLVGLRSRMGAMYGPTSASFVSYAVGKESAQKAVAQMIESKFIKPDDLWKKLPHWFRLMGYGKLKLLTDPKSDELRVVIEDSFESVHPDGSKSPCDLTRGYLAGLGQALKPGLDCEVEETGCHQRDGRTACEFTIRWFQPIDAVEVSLLLQTRPGNTSGG